MTTVETTENPTVVSAAMLKAVGLKETDLFKAPSGANDLGERLSSFVATSIQKAAKDANKAERFGFDRSLMSVYGASFQMSADEIAVLKDTCIPSKITPDDTDWCNDMGEPLYSSQTLRNKRRHYGLMLNAAARGVSPLVLRKAVDDARSAPITHNACMTSRAVSVYNIRKTTKAGKVTMREVTSKRDIMSSPEEGLNTAANVVIEVIDALDRGESFTGEKANLLCSRQVGSRVFYDVDTANLGRLLHSKWNVVEVRAETENAGDDDEPNVPGDPKAQEPAPQEIAEPNVPNEPKAQEPAPQEVAEPTDDECLADMVDETTAPADESTTSELDALTEDAGEGTIEVIGDADGDDEIVEIVESTQDTSVKDAITYMRRMFVRETSLLMEYYEECGVAKPRLTELEQFLAGWAGRAAASIDNVVKIAAWEEERQEANSIDNVTDE